MTWNDSGVTADPLPGNGSGNSPRAPYSRIGRVCTATATGERCGGCVLRYRTDALHGFCEPLKSSQFASRKAASAWLGDSGYIWYAIIMASTRTRYTAWVSGDNRPHDWSCPILSFYFVVPFVHRPVNIEDGHQHVGGVKAAVGPHLAGPTGRRAQ